MSECRYCKKESYDRPYCPACAKKYFNMDLSIPKKINISNDTRASKSQNSPKFKTNNINSFSERKTARDDQCEFPQEKYKTFKERENEKIYKCKSGIIVRSISEKIISDYLTDNNISHLYENELRYNERKPGYIYFIERAIHPDFFIKGPINYKGRTLNNIYIEFWGLDSDEYNDTKEYKENVYRQLNLTLINLYKEDMIDINKSLDYKLRYFKYNILNF